MTTIAVTRDNFFDIIGLIHNRLFVTPTVQVAFVDDEEKYIDDAIQKTMIHVQKKGLLKKASALIDTYKKQGVL